MFHNLYVLVQCKNTLNIPYYFGNMEIMDRHATIDNQRLTTKACTPVNITGQLINIIYEIFI